MRDPFFSILNPPGETSAMRNLFLLIKAFLEHKEHKEPRRTQRKASCPSCVFAVSFVLQNFSSHIELPIVGYAEEVLPFK